MNRRGFMAGILAAGAAPAFARYGVLMPIRPAILRISDFEWAPVLFWSSGDVIIYSGVHNDHESNAVGVFDLKDGVFKLMESGSFNLQMPSNHLRLA